MLAPSPRLVMVLAVLAGCGEDPYPWERAGAPPPLPPRPLASASAELVPVRPAAAELHARCLDGFTPSGEPVRDVVRLGVACGPATGMSRLGEVPHEGVVAAGGASVVVPMRLRAGHCYRVFVAADAEVSGLAIEVRSSRGTTLSRAGGEGRIVVIHPTEPLCAVGDDAVELLVSAASGRGRFALEAWSYAGALPEPGIDGDPGGG